MVRRRWTPAPSTTGSGGTTWSTGRDDWLMLCLPALEMRRHLEAFQAYAPGARTATEASCRLPGGLDPATSERPSLINTVPMSRRAGWRRAMAVWRAVSARARWERTTSSTIFSNAYQLTSMTLLRGGHRCPRAFHLPFPNRWVVVRARAFSSGVSNIGHFQPAAARSGSGAWAIPVTH